MSLKPYYQDQAVTIYLGDCRDILPSLEQVDLVLTDPPYGTEDLGGGYGRRQNHDPLGRNGRRIVGDSDLSILLESIAPLYGLLKDGGYLFSFCAPRRMLDVGNLITNVGLEFYGEMIWDKASPGLGYTIRYRHESCLVFRKGDCETPQDALTSLFYSPVDRVDTEQRHPHEKPIEFWKHIMRISNGLILDPFMGSGTTLRAAKDLGRKAIGIEIEERYAEIAARRMSQEVLDLK